MVFGRQRRYRTRRFRHAVKLGKAAAKNIYSRFEERQRHWGGPVKHKFKLRKINVMHFGLIDDNLDGGRYKEELRDFIFIDIAQNVSRNEVTHNNARRAVGEAR